MKIAYKLFSIKKDGSIGSLFINRQNRLPLNEWLKAESHRTEGFKYRPYWHATENPVAPHLSMKNRAWYVVEIDDYTEFKRPSSQGNVWYLANNMRIIKKYEQH